MLRTAGVPLDALPWRKPSLAAADAGHRRLSARPPDQLWAGDGRTRSIGAVRSQLSRPRLDQGLSGPDEPRRSEEHTSELQSLMRISYAVFCLKKNKHSTQ